MESKYEYTIIFQPRSGSTLLTHFLSETYVLGFPKETFSDYWIKEIYDECGISASNAPRMYIEEMKRKSTTSNGVFGHKISLYQIKRYLDDSFFDFYPRSHLFYITRKNKVYQAVSDYLASETNEWAKIKGEEYKNTSKNIKYSGEKIKAKFLYHYQNEIEMQNFLKRSSVNLNRTIYYEDLCLNPNAIIHYISNEMSINYKKEKFFKIESARYQKQRTSINDEFVNKFLMDERDLVKQTFEELEATGFSAISI